MEFLGDFIGNLQWDLCVVWLGFLLVFLGFLLGFLGDFIWNFQRDLCVLLGLDFCWFFFFFFFFWISIGFERDFYGELREERGRGKRQKREGE